MDAKNISALRSITLVSAYLAIIFLPVFKGDASSSTFMSLKEALATSSAYKWDFVLKFLRFMPYIALITVSILYVLYVKNRTQENLNNLKRLSLFLLWAFVFDFAYTVFFFTMTGTSGSILTMVPVVIVLLIALFTYLVFWREKSLREDKNLNSELVKPSPNEASATTTDTPPNSKSSPIGCLVGIVLIGGVLWLYRTCTNKIEDVKEESGYNENLEKSKDYLKSELMVWFRSLSSGLQLFLGVLICSIIGYIVVAQFKKRLLH